MSIKNVCLLGANGNVGPMVLHALVKDGFNVTVLKRASSKSSSDYPSGVKVAEVDDAFAVDDLVPIFKGQDAVVVTIKGTQVDIQKRLADASVKAGVKRFIPADFGSCDSSSPHAQDCVPLFANKTELRSYLTELTEKNKDFTWSSIVCGHFFDWDTAFLHLWPKEKRADIVKDGTLKASYSTLARVGELAVPSMKLRGWMLIRTSASRRPSAMKETKMRSKIWSGYWALSRATGRKGTSSLWVYLA